MGHSHTFGTQDFSTTMNRDSNMFHLGISVLILLVLRTPPTECQASLGGPFHVWGDDYAQMYTVDKSTNVEEYGPFINLPGSSDSIPVTPEIPSGSKWLAVVASNSGPFTDENPAGFLLSSDQDTSPKIITDRSWRCKGFNATIIPADEWPNSEPAQYLLKETVADWWKVPRAATLTSANFGFRNSPKTKISLGAQLIWAADLLPISNEIPTYVICLRKLKKRKGNIG